MCRTFDILLEDVFNKYTQQNRMSFEQFHAFIKRLSKHTNVNKDLSNTQVAFAYLDKDEDGFLTFNDFKLWFIKENKYNIFCGAKHLLLKKAYWLYKSYAKQGGLSLNHFREMMDDLGIDFEDEEFANIDLNGDGLLNFDEFCRWLKWF